ncbi:MAG TPA: sugar nucleotide-binding protein [Candidatus Gastranaerophilaceae bacterium]|nr:sugar nucleotide-binding protein [Candidatus Gastranaerophilaceae bacterium]HPT42151.1 sugar nucleotide-binding protein [Candidatus Gastranaerophilaceae bacterium]
MCKILLLGATGLLGQALGNEARKRSHEIIGVAHSNTDFNMDISDGLVLTKLIREQKPEIVINACAVVNHKLCDENIKLAYEVNARPSSIIANLANELGFYYVFISTDGYYNGDKNKKHKPKDKIYILNEYARTKYAGECFALTSKNSLVVRTNIVGFRGRKDNPTFLEWVINSLKEQSEMTLFDDYYTSSITVVQFSKALFDLLDKKPSGILNLASSQVSSKKEFIEKVAKEIDFSLAKTKTGSVKDLTTSIRADSLGLDVSETEKLLGYELPNLDEVIEQIKKEYYELG